MPINFALGLPPEREITIPEGQDPFGSFISGVASGYGAISNFKKERKAFNEQQDLPEEDRQQLQASGELVGKPSAAGAIIQGFLGAKAFRQQATNPLQAEAFNLQNESRRIQNETEQLNLEITRETLSGIGSSVEKARANAPTRIRETFDKLGNARTSTQIFEVLKDNPNLFVNPITRTYANAMRDVANQMQQHEMTSQDILLKNHIAKENAELVTKYGAIPSDPESFTSARRNRSFERLLEMAQKAGKDLGFGVEPPVDALGNLDLPKAYAIIQQAPVIMPPTVPGMAPSSITVGPPGARTTLKAIDPPESVEHLPRLFEQDGRKFLVNPRTGRFMELSLDPIEKAKLETKLNQLRDVSKEILTALGEDDSPKRTEKLQILRRHKEQLEAEINSFDGGSNGVAASTQPSGSAPAELPRVTSKDQFDRLPSGSVYVGKDGRKYRKP